MMDKRNDFPSLPKGWTRVRLGDIITLEYGKGLVESKRDSNGNIPVYGSNGLVGRHSTALVNEPCLIVGRKGSAGSVHISDVPCWAIDTTYYVIPPDGVPLHFLYYWLSNLQLDSLDRSTAIPGLNRNDAYALNVPFPPHREQHRIVTKIEELFSDLDAGVAELEKAKAQLKRYRQAVLKAAVEGKLTAEWRAANKDKLEPASMLVERIRTERAKNGRGKEKALPPANKAELGELPEGWVYCRTADIAEVRLGRQRSPSRAIGPYMRRYLRAANVTWNGLDLSDVKEMDFNPTEFPNYQLRRGDILLSEASGSISEVGKPAIWNEQIQDCCFQNTLIRVRSYSPLPSYLNLHFYYDARAERFRQIAKGVGIHHLGAENLSNWVIALPPLVEQQQIVAEVERRLSVADEIAKTVDASLKQAERLRQSILKRAFEGKLVPQDPGDEPAERLLERIRESKSVIPNPARSKPDKKRKAARAKQPRLIS